MYYERFRSKVLFGSLLGYLLLREVVDGAIVIDGTVVLRPSVGTAIPLGILFGPVAAIGIALGALVFDVVHFAVSLGSVVTSLSLFVVACAAWLMWEYSLVSLRTGARARARDFTDGKAWLEFAAITGVLSVGGAAFVGWTYEVLGLFPFYLSFIDEFTNFVVGTAMLSPFLLYPLSRRHRRKDLATHTDSGHLHTVVPIRHRVAIAALPLAWTLLAMTGSIGFHIRERILLLSFRQRNAEWVYYVIHPDTFGYGGRRVQVIFGTIVLLLMYALLAGVVRSNSGEST